MNSIFSIEDLIEKLRHAMLSDYESILSHTRIPLGIYEPYLSWSKEKYTRNLIYKCDDFEILIMGWEIGQNTFPHDHGGKRCWIRLVQGSIQEIIYQEENKKLSEVRTHDIQKNEVEYIEDSIGCHSLKNIYKGRSISLHLYASPIESYNCYNLDQECFFHKTI